MWSRVTHWGCSLSLVDIRVSQHVPRRRVGHSRASCIAAGPAGASAGQDRGWRLKVNFAKLQLEKSVGGVAAQG